MTEDQLKLIAIQEFTSTEDLYRVVDFLNKSLKEKDLIFGIKKNGDKMQIIIYEG